MRGQASGQRRLAAHQGAWVEVHALRVADAEVHTAVGPGQHGASGDDLPLEHLDRGDERVTGTQTVGMEHRDVEAASDLPGEDHLAAG